MTTWSLRRRITLTFAGTALLAVLGTVVGIVAFSRLLDARHEVIDELDPASVALRDLLAAMLDQETGVRGFVLAGDESFLLPYTQGQESADAASRRLEELLGGSHELDALHDDIVAAVDAWRRDYAEPVIARVRAEGPGEADPDVVDLGQRRFDDVRTALRTLEDRLAVHRDAGVDDLSRATQALVGALAAIAAVIVLVGVFAWFVMTRWVLQPLDRLGYSTRMVAAGHLAYPIEGGGPPEIQRLDEDVRAMRARIVDELESLRAARAELDERANELARSNADLEQFAYVASHDLQEPLRKVASFCQLLQRRYEGQLDERADQYIEFAVDGARRMQQLINDLLAFSRVGRTTERFEPVDLNVKLGRALGDLQSVIDANDAKINSGDLPTVMGDAPLLGTVLRNLVSNAIKFRSDEPPVIDISAELQGDEWVISVSDNGIGISPEYAEKVFVIFQRLHTRDQYEGTGIGLSIAKKIVEFHGGRMWVDLDCTAPGTTIRFTLPVMRSTSE